MSLKKIFVTGCYRSGTTLLEKMLHSQSGISIASQPFASFYFFAKERFFEEKGIDRTYPVDPMFPEDAWSLFELEEFLQRYVFSNQDIEEVYRRLERDDLGLWTPEILDAGKAIRPGRFEAVLEDLHRVIRETFPKPGLEGTGSKEILMEEFVPVLSGIGEYCVIIIRDPRDMIASLNFNEKDNATGANRPVLYSLRLWRKSVAIALRMGASGDAHWLQYEDLVENPVDELVAALQFLGVATMDGLQFREGLKDQHGRLWSGNSSFSGYAGISSASVGRYKQVLPPSVKEYVEAVCRPEMIALGYEVTGPKKPDRSVIENYADPFDRVHGKFPSDYSSNPERIDEEMKRIDKLFDRYELDGDQASKWFHSREAYKILRDCVVT